MPVVSSPPLTPVDPVVEVLHGVAITDPYRWLEEQNSPETRQWIDAQTRYARSYLDAIAGRHQIHKRIREFLAVETCDCLQKVGNRYFFRKRLPDQEQPCIYMREGFEGEDQLLIDPADRGSGKYLAVNPLRVSANGELLLFEVKQGGERTGVFELFDVQKRKVLPDKLPRGYLRGFVFAPDAKSFYYVHEGLNAARPNYRAAYHHVLGTPFDQDRSVFFAGEDAKLRLCLIGGADHLGFLVYHFQRTKCTDFYVKALESDDPPVAVVQAATFVFAPALLNDRLLAETDRDAPNLKIVEVRSAENREPEFIDIVATQNARIQNWCVAGQHIFVSYLREAETEIVIFDLAGNQLERLASDKGGTLRLLDGPVEATEVFFETESFAQPVSIWRYNPKTTTRDIWFRKQIPFASERCASRQVWYESSDGTIVPMYLFARNDVLEDGCHPVIMTSYGGYGVPMTPQFSAFVAFLVERGCLFALPNIRGGSEFGTAWHTAATRRCKQTSYDDFLAAARWLIGTGRTKPGRLAIFGGSNSGLLVAAALTQRPELFRAVVCMVPLLDMLRYHLFDNAHVWAEEFGTADDPEDFAALLAYSPYQNVRDCVAYPAVLLVSGDADRNCNPLHARKMTARLQAANSSEYPILLDYSEFRGHSAVLPLSTRSEALTDRMAFLCDQLQLQV